MNKREEEEEGEADWYIQSGRDRLVEKTREIMGMNRDKHE